MLTTQATVPADAAEPATPALSGALLLLFATTAGLAVANNYYNQPMLGLMVAELGPLASQVPTATQIGYALGLVLLVPLGDCADRRRLILWQTAGLTVALVLAAAAPGAATELVAAVAVGVCATIAQQVVPLAAELCAPEARGRTLGTVMSGMLAGILLARTLSGLVAEHAGWRAMFWLGAAIAVGMAALFAAFLPRTVQRSPARYASMLRSLLELIATHRVLRRATLTQACLFGCFSVFWSTLALLLQTPRYGLGPEAAGLFGIIGVCGVAVAPLAGRLADRSGPHGVIRIGCVLVVAAFALFGAWPTLAGIVLGVLLLDAGVQLSMVPNQTLVIGLDDTARARLNTIYVAGLFVGGSIGSALAGLAWHEAGWRAVAALGVVLAACALALQLGRRHDG